MFVVLFTTDVIKALDVSLSVNLLARINQRLDHLAWQAPISVKDPRFWLAFVVSGARRKEDGHFSRDETERLNTAFSRPRFAGSLAMRVGFKATLTTAEALACEGQHLALLNQQGRVYHMSAKFLIKLGDGLALKTGRLSAADNKTTTAMEALIHGALHREGAGNHGCGAVVLPRRFGRRPLTWTVFAETIRKPS